MKEENRIIGRRLGFGGVDMVKCRIRHSLTCMDNIKTEYTPLVEKIWYKNSCNPPFDWVGIIFRYGLKNEDKPHYSRINQSYGDLPLAIELDTNELLWADKQGLEALTLLFKVATLKCLIHAGRKYKLPVEELEVELVNRQAELMGREWWRVYLEAE